MVPGLDLPREEPAGGRRLRPAKRVPAGAALQPCQPRAGRGLGSPGAGRGLGSPRTGTAEDEMLPGTGPSAGVCEGCLNLWTRQDHCALSNF